MKIFLINPIHYLDPSVAAMSKSQFPPLGLAYIAGYLSRAGHACRIADRNILYRRHGYDLAGTDREVLEDIRLFGPDFIGIGAVTQHMYDVRGFTDILKKDFPSVPVFLGGVHPTVEPEESLRMCKSIDRVVVGEGEKTILELLERFPAPDIKGTAFLKDGKFVSGGERGAMEDLDEIPYPRRDLLDMDFYSAPTHERGLYFRMTTVITSRGCPYSCRFCASPAIYHRRVRYHSVPYVLGEVIDVFTKYSVKCVYFADDFFLADKKRAAEICEGMIKEKRVAGLKWIAQLRPEIVDTELLTLMRGAGCVQVEYGFESGSDDELRRMGKKSDRLLYESVAGVTRRSGLRFQANMIYGYPDETGEDLDRSFDFIRKIRADKTQFTRFIPLPGTAAYDEILKKGVPLEWHHSSGYGAGELNFTRMSDDALRENADRMRQEIDRNNRVSFILGNLRHSPARLVRHYACRAVEKAARIW